MGNQAQLPAQAPKPPGVSKKIYEYAADSDLEGVQRCVASGVSVNGEKDRNGWNALHYAAGRGHVAVVRYLLSVGADKDARSSSGLTPIMHAAMNGHEEVLQ